MVAEINGTAYWKSPPKQLVLVFSLLAVLAFIYKDGLWLMTLWWEREEYSHGYLIPFISLYMLWQSRNRIAEHTYAGSWLGIPVLLFGLALYVMGELSSLYTIIQYGFLAALLGFALSIAGRPLFGTIALPLSFLFFAIPLPNFLYNNLSSKLQLWSSKLGVSVIRLFDISVYLEGNVIDLGSLQLQVVEACSGLRYLFPLMSLAFICASFYQVNFWKRLVVFLSSVPITLLMNSFRIGVIGVTVEYFGKAAAEGFLHDFEGWFVFMACGAILLLEMWTLARLGRDPRPLSEVFGITIPEPLPDSAVFHERRLPLQYWVAGLVILLTLGFSFTLVERQEIIPRRTDFAEFPLKLGDWTGRRERLEQKYIDQLKFEDYILADFTEPKLAYPVNLYVAYYETQRKGESIHSPSSCIPGGGWQIQSHEVITLQTSNPARSSMPVNRLLIQKGESRQLVYYWFQQRGRIMTNEYLIKWYLFWDAMTMNRSDGALVRLTTVSPKGEELGDADRRLTEFLGLALGEVPRFIPE